MLSAVAFVKSPLVVMVKFASLMLNVSIAVSSVALY